MSKVAQVDDRNDAQERTALTEEEQVFAKACLDAITPEQRARITDLDMLTVIRGYQTYEPRLEETVKAMQMIVKWRDEVHHERFLQERLPQDEEFHTVWPERVHGADKYGHLIVASRFQEVDTDSLHKNFEEQHMLRLQGQKMAALQQHKADHAKTLGTQRYKHIIVTDLDGVGLGILGGSKRGIIKQLMDVGGNYYPESVWKIFIINAPFVFRALWAIVTTMIHPITAAKVNVLGSPKDAMKKMAEFGIEPEQLPTWMGGKSEGRPLFDILKEYIDKDNSEERAVADVQRKLEAATV